MQSTPKGRLMEAAASSISTRVAARRVEAPRERTLPQLGLRRIIAVWAAAALPMALLAWVVSPLLADQFTGAARLPRALIVTLTAGLIWQIAPGIVLLAPAERKV